MWALNANPPCVRSALLGDVPHGFFGRRGGVSTGGVASLNTGIGSDDDPMLVARNRAAVRAMCKVRIGPLIISDVKILYPVLSSHAFVSWPSRKVGNAWHPLVQILAPGLEQRITNAVIHAWRNADRHGGVR